MGKLVDVENLKEWIFNWFEMVRYYHPYAKSNNIPIDELYDILDRIEQADAIPKEWLRTWFLNNVINHGELFDLLISDWEKENGKAS